MAVCTLTAVLAGCGAKTNTPSQIDKPQTDTNAQQSVTPNETQAKTEQNHTEVAAGTILDAPEVTFDENAEQLYIYYTYPGDKEEEVLSTEIAIDQVTEDTYVIYMSDGLLKLHEVIYEVTDSGVSKYYKDTFMENFALETELSQAALEQEKTSMLSLLSQFMSPSSYLEGVKYRKSDAPAFALTGEVYVYDLIENDNVAGQIYIDKATGLMVSLKDTNGTSQYSVQSIKTSDLGIPAYK